MLNLLWVLERIYYSPIGKYVTPNRISYIRTFIGWLAIPLIALNCDWMALTFIVVSLYLDHIDGVWARHFEQITRWGGYIDRTCDKLLVIPFLLFFELFKPYSFCENQLFFYVIIPLVLIELIALQWSIFQWIAEWVPYNIKFKKDNSAKWHGKIKMILECILMITMVLFSNVKNEEFLVKTFIALSTLAFIMAILSLIGHITAMEFKKLLSRSISEPSS